MPVLLSKIQSVSLAKQHPFDEGCQNFTLTIEGEGGWQLADLRRLPNMASPQVINCILENQTQNIIFQMIYWYIIKWVGDWYMVYIFNYKYLWFLYGILVYHYEICVLEVVYQKYEANIMLSVNAPPGAANSHFR